MPLLPVLPASVIGFPISSLQLWFGLCRGAGSTALGCHPAPVHRPIRIRFTIAFQPNLVSAFATALDTLDFILCKTFVFALSLG